MDDVKQDVFAILNAVPDGYGHLHLAITEGRIDPLNANVMKVMRCGCVKAHLADFRKCASSSLPPPARCLCNGLKSLSPVERYISWVAIGQTPDTSPVLRQLLSWIEEWRQSQGCEFEIEDEGVEF